MRIVVIGAGGLAREMKWLIEEIGVSNGELEFIGYVVSNLNSVGEHDSREEILGDYNWLKQNGQHFDGIVLGIGNPTHRLKVVREISEFLPNAHWPALIHPSISFDRTSTSLGQGCILCAGVRLTVNNKIDDFALLNLNVTVGHEAKVGAGVVINPGANISGGVIIEKGVLVGTGAQVLQYLKVGEDSVVGAGAVVNKDVGEAMTVVGIPARPVSRVH